MAHPTPSEPAPTDAELLQLCRHDQRAAFAALTRRYYRPICGFILKRVHAPGLVEDLAQETFLEAYRTVASGRPPDQFASWLFGIAHNRCGKWLRRRRPILFAEPPDTMASSRVNGAEEREEQERLLAGLQAGLATLPVEAQLMLQKKHQHGQTCAQIAQELDRPVGTVKSQLSRAYQLLRAHLGEFRSEAR